MGAVAVAMEEHLKLHEEHAFSKLTVYANPSHLRANTSRKLCAQIQVPEHVKVKHVGLLDTRCIYHMCTNRQGGRWGDHSRASSIWQMCCSKLGAHELCSNIERNVALDVVAPFVVQRCSIAQRRLHDSKTD